MALCDTLCFLLFGTFLCSLPMLHGCEKQNVCTFPVYPTEFCPRNQTEWDKRSSDMNCNETNSYMCVPNEKFTELLEFCYKHPRMLIVQDTCLYLSRSHYDVNIYDCRNFEYGCPSYHYLSSSIYKYPSCVHVKNGCFVAEPSCRRQPPERENQINIKTIAITLGVSIPTCILCILFVYFVIKRKSAKVLGSTVTVEFTSDGTFTTFPRKPFCLPRGFSTSYMKGILGLINLSSNSVMFKYGGYSGNPIPFTTAKHGIFPAFKCL